MAPAQFTLSWITHPGGNWLPCGEAIPMTAYGESYEQETEASRQQPGMRISLAVKSSAPAKPSDDAAQPTA